MASDLSKHINIGKDTEAKLIEVGIDSFEKLVATGSEGAFLQLQTLDPGACLCLLYGLEGAIEGVKYNQLSPQKKTDLQEFHRMAQKEFNNPYKRFSSSDTMSINRAEIESRLCYTELVYGRINKKLRQQLTNSEIEAMMLSIIHETPVDFFQRIGKNIYVTSTEKKIRITINSNTYRIITVDQLIV